MTTMARQPSVSSSSGTDPLHLIDVDHVRFFVGNAKQAAYFYAYVYGFQIEQYADLTTGSRDAAHYLLTQGNIRMVLSSPLTSEHPAAMETALYGDGVKDVAFTVFDAAAAFERAVKNGAVPNQGPQTTTDEYGSITTASI
ncbi:MAG: VOC family protein, partial [Planctomycetota bacterium]|nr:VOC family protein [Planctomycetota bacterium]